MPIELEISMPSARTLARVGAVVAMTVLVLFGLGRDVVRAQAIPNVMAHQGRLLNASNVPITTTVSVNFAIYNAATGGTQVWNETKSITPDSLGFYETFLGDTTALPPTISDPSYLQVTVQGEVLSPRLRVGAVPFAQLAGGDFGSQNITTVGGRVGIGTTSPVSLLHLKGPFPGVGSGIVIEGQTGNASDIQFFNGSTQVGFLCAPYLASFCGADAVVNDVSLSSINGGRILFGTSTGSSNPPARVTITNPGDVGLGTTTPQSRLQVVGNYIQFPTISGAAPPATDCNTSAQAGRGVVRTDGTTNLYICAGTGGWIGK